MYRTIAPWITENPLMMHLTSFHLPHIQNAVKQMKEVGFEMLIFSFGSNFNNNVLELGIHHPEWVDEMIEEFNEEVFEPIHAEDIHFGGYSLLASRKISRDDDVVNPFADQPREEETIGTFAQDVDLFGWNLLTVKGRVMV